jgi:hypothetical protein
MIKLAKPRWPKLQNVAPFVFQASIGLLLLQEQYPLDGRQSWEGAYTSGPPVALAECDLQSV